MQGWGGSSGLWGLLGLTPLLEEALHPSLFSRERGPVRSPGCSGRGSFDTQGRPAVAPGLFGSDLAALLLHRKAFPCQSEGGKFLIERGDLEMEKL